MNSSMYLTKQHINFVCNAAKWRISRTLVGMQGRVVQCSVCVVCKYIVSFHCSNENDENQEDRECEVELCSVLYVVCQ